MKISPSFFPIFRTGCWDRPPARARLVPIARQGQDKPVGVFITALNPYRQFDGFYEGFLDLITGQIAASITNANAYEQERKRAEELAELDRAKTTFFSNVSHELRTPLTLILGPIEDALTSQSPPSPQNLEMLHRNALRLLKLVNGLLDFVRIEVGKLRATFEADRPLAVHGTACQRLPLRGGAGRIATGCGLPAAAGTRVCRPRDVGEDHSQSHLERAQIDVSKERSG